MYRLINRNNPMEGIEVGSVLNDRTVFEICEPEIFLDKDLRKRKKYFVMVRCSEGHERKVEVRSFLHHGCPSCAKSESWKNILWRYNPVT